MRVAINLLTDNPDYPTGAHWFWTRVIPEMSRQLEPGEELHLLVSRRSRHHFQGYGPNVHYITYPWSNERRVLRTLSEHVYSPLRLPWNQIDILNTLMAPLLNPTWSLVIHMKTMHAFTAPESLSPLALAYRRMMYPRSAAHAEAIILNSESIRGDVHRYLDVDPAKIRMIYEAVDHELFRPGDRDQARRQIAAHGVTRPFVLFVSSLWPYKNCEGLLRAWALVRDEIGDRQLIIVGPDRHTEYVEQLRDLVRRLDIGNDVLFVGGVPLEETASFYRAADAFVYPSFSETFGLPILEAMACDCPVVTSNISAMPEIAGGAALLADPHDPAAIGAAMVRACGPEGDDLRRRGRARAAEFTWAATAAATLAVYREVAERRQRARAKRKGRRPGLGKAVR